MGEWINIAIAFAILVGVIGTILPIVPGISLVWASILVYGIVEGFTAGGIWMFVAVTVLAILAVASNVILPSRRAGRVGARGLSIGLGVLGALIGLFTVPIIGLPLGGAVGIFGGEVLQGRDRQQAWLATKEALIGIGLSIMLQFTFALWMALLWVIWLVAL